MFVAHQPYFFPWLGYFAKLARVDTFVVMDDAQFRKRHHYDRTQIIGMHGEPLWLRASVTERLGQTCAEATLSKTVDPARIARTVADSYSKADFRSLHPHLDEILQTHIAPSGPFTQSSLSIIDATMRLLGVLRPRYVLSSSLNLSGLDATDRLLRISSFLDDRDLLVGNGSFHAVHDVAALQSAGIRIHMRDYLAHHPIYSQSRRRRLPFIKGLSIIDALLNVGPKETASFITSKDGAIA